MHILPPMLKKEELMVITNNYYNVDKRALTKMQKKRESGL